MFNQETVNEELVRLRAENIALKTKPTVAISYKVSDKGAISLYGLQRFPVTLYAEQWKRVIKDIDKLNNFINRNSHSLSTKADADLAKKMGN